MMQAEKVILAAMLLSLLSAAACPLYPASNMQSQERLNRELARAVQSSNIRRVKQLLAAGADPNSRDYSFREPQAIKEQDEDAPDTVLHEAVLHNDDVAIAGALLEHGAHVNAMSIHGTPLMGAAYMGNPQSVRLLLRHDADPRIQRDVEHSTALKSAEETLSWLKKRPRIHREWIAKCNEVIRILKRAGEKE